GRGERSRGRIRRCVPRRRGSRSHGWGRRSSVLLSLVVGRGSGRVLGGVVGVVGAGPLAVPGRALVHAGLVVHVGVVLVAVAAAAVALPGVGHGAGPLLGDGDRRVGPVARLRLRGLEQAVADRGLVVGVDEPAIAGAAAAQLLMGAGVADAAAV